MKDAIQQNPSSNLPALSVSGADLASTLAGKSHAEKLALLAKVTSYTGAETERIDKYLNMKLNVTGAVVQRNAHVRLDEPKVNPDGSVEEYGVGDRVIMKFVVDGDKQNTEHAASFMSMAVAGFFDNFIFPSFGQGDFEAPVPMKVIQTTAKAGRSYNVQVVA